MSFSPLRTFEEIKEQVGPITGQPPGAWWVGTDKLLPMRDDYLAARKEDSQRRKDLAESIDTDPGKTWSFSRSEGIIGFTPNDPENTDPALREDRNTPGMWVPNKRTKAGKDLAARMVEVNNQAAKEELPGASGGVSAFMGGQLYRSRLGFRIPKGHYPVAYISKNPDDEDASPCPFYGEITVDPNLWERIPRSWIMRIIEESEA